MEAARAPAAGEITRVERYIVTPSNPATCAVCGLEIPPYGEVFQVTYEAEGKGVTVDQHRPDANCI